MKEIIKEFYDTAGSWNWSPTLLPCLNCDNALVKEYDLEANSFICHQCNCKDVKVIEWTFNNNIIINVLGKEYFIKDEFIYFQFYYEKEKEIKKTIKLKAFL